MRSTFARAEAASGAGAVAAIRRSLDKLLTVYGSVPWQTSYTVFREGIDPSLVACIADAANRSRQQLFSHLDIPATTLKRKKAEGGALPEAQSYRVLGFLTIAARLHRMLQESGDPEALKSFDLFGWLVDWMNEPNPSLGDVTPFAALRSPTGLQEVESLLERMRTGVAA